MVYDTIGVQGYAKIDGKMVCIERKIYRKFDVYPIKELVKNIVTINPNVEYVKVYKNTPINVLFLRWFDTNGTEIEWKVMDMIFGIDLGRN